MKPYREKLWFQTRNRRELINITPQMAGCLAKSGIREGLRLVNPNKAQQHNPKLKGGITNVIEKF